MKLDNPHETGLLRQPITEQAMAWLVENGPIVSSPPLPQWTLEALVRARRVARLRRDLYLAPDRTGKMPTLGAIAGIVGAGGYLSFSAAFELLGLTDQLSAEWGMVSPTRQAPVRYGQRRLRFFFSPERAARGHWRALTVGSGEVAVATAAQAVVDSLQFRRNGPSLSDLVRIVATAVQSGRLDVAELTQLVVKEDSPALARRAGFLLNMVGIEPDTRLHELAVRVNDRTVFDPGQEAALNPKWRLVLPRSVEDLELSLVER